jgi:hypothetical protein
MKIGNVTKGRFRAESLLKLKGENFQTSDSKSRRIIKATRATMLLKMY